MTNSNTLRPGWTPVTIGLMVLGFVAFWPLGLAMLAYILWGDQFQDMFRDARTHFDGMMRQGGPQCRNRRSARPVNSGNVAFDDFRQVEIDRLEAERRRLDEERKKLDAMEDEFNDFLRNLRRAKDQEEFDRFMNARDSSGSSKGTGPSSGFDDFMPGDPKPAS